MQNKSLLMLAFAVAMKANCQLNYYQKLDNYNFDYIPLELGGMMNPGQGIKVKDYIDFSPASYSPFLDQNKVVKLVNEVIDRSVIENAQFYLNENLTTNEKARSYYVNFKTTFGFINAKAAYERALSEQNTCKSFQIVMEARKSGQALPDSKKDWNRFKLYKDFLLKVEANNSLSNRSQNFIDLFGTHYIMSVQTGFRIEILATINSTDMTEQENFKASLKAWVANVNAGSSTKQSVSSKNTTIVCKISSGGIEPRMASIIEGYEKISSFIDSVKQGKYTVYNGPIGAYVQSYNGTLLNYPQTAEIFKANPNVVHIDGLPIGSIIAWNPKSEDIVNGVITPPQGWAICNGDNDTPNLCGRFIKGIDKDQKNVFDPKDISSVTITNTTTDITDERLKRNVELDGRFGAIGNHQHSYSFTISNQDLLPPYLTLVYIIKLE